MLGLQNRMLNMVIAHFENIADPDQLASWMPADQDQQCFPLHLFELILCPGQQSFSYVRTEVIPRGKSFGSARIRTQNS